MRAALALLVFALAASPAAAEPTGDAPAMTAEARAHWERGLAAHAAHHYDAASAEFAACYRLSQRRECLFAWAQATRLSGDCATAIGLYHRYLEADVSPRQAAATRSRIAACEAAIAAQPASGASIAVDAHRAAEPPPTTAAPPAAVAQASPSPTTWPASPRSPGRSPWYHDLWGDALIVTGLAGVTAGSLLYLAARSDASATPPTYAGYSDRFVDARRARAWAVVTAGIGAALITAGIVHVVLRNDTPAPPLGVELSAAAFELHYARAF